jgi:hypothetical protein
MWFAVTSGVHTNGHSTSIWVTSGASGPHTFKMYP